MSRKFIVRLLAISQRFFSYARENESERRKKFQINKHKKKKKYVIYNRRNHKLNSYEKISDGFFPTSYVVNLPGKTNTQISLAKNIESIQDKYQVRAVLYTLWTV